MNIKSLFALTIANLIMVSSVFAAPKACMQTVSGMFGNTKACFQSQGISEKTFKDLCESRVLPSSKLTKVSATYLHTDCPTGYKGACLNMSIERDAKKKYSLYHYENEMDIVKKGCEQLKGKWVKGSS